MDTKYRKKNPITCEECSTVYRERPDCPNCGAVPVKKGKVLPVVDGELGRVERNGDFKTHQFSIFQKERFYRELKHIQEHRRYKPGWVAFKYKERLGEWPKNIQGPPIPPSPETLSYIRKQVIAYAKGKRRAG